MTRLFVDVWVNVQGKQKAQNHPKKPVEGYGRD